MNSEESIYLPQKNPLTKFVLWKLWAQADFGRVNHGIEVELGPHFWDQSRTRLDKNLPALLLITTKFL